MNDKKEIRKAIGLVKDDLEGKIIIAQENKKKPKEGSTEPVRDFVEEIVGDIKEQEDLNEPIDIDAITTEDAPKYKQEEYPVEPEASEAGSDEKELEESPLSELPGSEEDILERPYVERGLIPPDIQGQETKEAKETKKLIMGKND